MYISKIELRDWKAYKSADFEFPEPTAGENIVLIGAPNGYGKTSLFESIILAMFGQDGMELIESNKPYKSFLEGALHDGAIIDGRNCCSVKMAFVDDNETVIEIQRTWYFTDSGNFIPDDEDIHIFEGEKNNLTPRGPIPDTPMRSERMEWYRNYIAHTFLHRHLATFFVFDGEQVSELARQEMTSQVKGGIEGLLGIPELRMLSENLKDYAKNRLGGTTKVTDENIQKTRKELDAIDKKLQQNIKKQAVLDPNLADAKNERDQITKELKRLGVGSQSSSNEQYTKLAEYQKNIEVNTARLEDIISKDIALALSGIGLREKLKQQLESENIRAKWESGKEQGDSRIDNFLAAMDQKIDDLIPPISDEQKAAVLIISHEAWQNLWFPPPENYAEEYLHEYCSVYERDKIIERLNELDKLGAKDIIALLDSINTDEQLQRKIRGEIALLEGVQPAVDKSHAKLKKLNEEITRWDKEIGALGRERESLDGMRNAKNAEYHKMLEQESHAKPIIRKVKSAQSVANMVDEIIKEAVPSQIKAVANEMTKAHQFMAHKSVVQRIDIDKNCYVRLLDANEKDVRRFDLSAGEKQIFTQSLFSAVSAVSKRVFPMVVDTPLARLDVEHRTAVLKHLAQREQQVILLSTDSEVVGTRLQEIESNVQKNI